MAVGDILYQDHNESERVPIYPTRGQLITPSDTYQFPNPVGITVYDAGTLIVVPWGAETPDPITFTITAEQVAGGPFEVRFMCKQVLEDAGAPSLIIGSW